MGNQVGCELSADGETLPYRIAYSFAIGDSMTVVLNPEGNLLSYWGQRDFSNLPCKETALRLIKNLTEFYRTQAAPYLYAGRMIAAPTVDCETVTFTVKKRGSIYTDKYPAVHATAWETDGKRVLILVNPQTRAINCRIDGKDFTVPPLDALLVPMN